MTRLDSRRGAHLLGAVALLLLASACDSAGDTFSRVDLEVGQRLEYETRYIGDGFFEGEAPYDVTGRLVERVAARNQTLEGRRGLTVVESESTDSESPGLTFRATTWYRPTAVRLEEIAYRFSGDGPALGGLRPAAPLADPSLPRLVNRFLAEHAAARPGDGDECPYNCETTFRDPARIVIEYPADAGRTWTHFDLDGFSSTREVLEMGSITNSAGTFLCAVVRTRLSDRSDRELDWIDWIGEAGLVQRRITYRTPFTRADGTAGESVATENADLVSIRR